MLPDHDLTSRELAVFALLAQGLLNKEIASHLDITVRSVERHITSIFRKLNLNNRTEAAIFYARELESVNRL